MMALWTRMRQCPNCRSRCDPRPCDLRHTHNEDVRADYHPAYCAYCPFCGRHGEHW